MKRKLRAYIFIIVMQVVSFSALAEQGWQSVLGRDLVIFNDSKMIFESYTLCKGVIKKANNKVMNSQIKLYAEAPKDGIISRDNFVSIASGMKNTLIARWKQLARLSLLKQGKKQDVVFSCKTLRKPIGKVSSVVNVYMTNEGMQVEMSLAGKSRRKTVEWKDLFQD